MRRCYALLLLAAATACEFGETTIPQGDPIVAIHAVMRRDLNRQWVLVEQTLTGAEADDSLRDVIPGNPPLVPVTGASVVVTNLSMPDDPCGAVFFLEEPLVPSVDTSAGLYWGPPGCPTMRTGDTLQLRVETADGDTVMGTTEVPGAESMILRVGSQSTPVPGQMLRMNRDVDTLKAEVVIAAGRAIQIEVGTPDSAGTVRTDFAMFVDSTVITIPGNLPNFLAGILGEESTAESEDAEPVFAAGRYYDATVALFDDRYFDYARSGNMRLSGRGFVNNLVGGMGVFGSMLAAIGRLEVVGELDDAREGRYMAAGEVDGVPVSVELELYVAAAGEDSTDLATFVRGDWSYGEIDTSAEGAFQGNTVHFTFHQKPDLQGPEVSAFLVAGVIEVSGPFEAQVLDRQLNIIGQVVISRP